MRQQAPPRNWRGVFCFHPFLYKNFSFYILTLSIVSCIITPAPSTDTCGQCHSTDKRGAGGRDRHRASQRTTRTRKHRTASPNAGCGCRQHRIPSCRRHMPRQFSVRTHNIQNPKHASPLQMIYIRSQPPMGELRGRLCASELPK